MLSFSLRSRGQLPALRRLAGSATLPRAGPWLSGRRRRASPPACRPPMFSLQTRFTGSKLSSPRGWHPRKSLVSSVPHPALNRIAVHVEILMQRSEYRSTSSPSDAISRFVRGSRPCSPQPRNVLVARHKRVLAVDALPGPVRHPLRSALQKLRRPKRVRQHESAARPDTSAATAPAACTATASAPRRCASAAIAIGNSCAFVPIASRSCL